MTPIYRRIVLVLVVLFTSWFYADGSLVQSPPEPGAVEVSFIHDRVLRLTLLDKQIPLTTLKGDKILIPVDDIEQISFAMRVSDDVSQKIAAAIADLGNEKFKRREAAAATLRRLREKACPALVKASKDADPEVSHTAKLLLNEMRDRVPEEALEGREHDVIVTKRGKISGKIDISTLKGRTAKGDEIEVKLADLRGLRSMVVVAFEEEMLKKAAPDPGNLQAYQNQVGKILVFKVKGQAGGPLWGTDTYTSDSSLAAAAVHAGLVKVGETKTVRVKMLGPQGSFVSSNRNGILSNPFGNWPAAYRFVKDRR